MSVAVAVAVPIGCAAAFLAFAWGLVQVTVASGSWLAGFGAAAAFLVACDYASAACIAAAAIASNAAERRP